MKLFGVDIREENKGYFGVRRCTECGNELRDVDLYIISRCFYVLGIPVKTLGQKKFLMCSKCKAVLELNDELWNYYKSYLGSRFNKSTTDEIVGTLNDLSKSGVNLNLKDAVFEKSLDLIYQKMVEKYGVWQNVEEIISVFYR